MNSPSTLAMLQEFFWATMRDDVVIEPQINARFAGRAPLDGVRRMAIYRRMFWSRQITAIEESFPRTRATLGQEQFRELAKAYLVAHPSRDPRLEMLGQDLPAFLQDRVPPGPAHEAAIEWSEMAVLLRPDEGKPLTSLGLSPKQLPTSVLSCLAALELVPDRAGGATVVWRREFTAWHCPVDADEWIALDQARQGATVAEICEEFAGAENPALRAATVLQGWLKRGWIVGVTS